MDYVFIDAYNRYIICIYTYTDITYKMDIIYTYLLYINRHIHLHTLHIHISDEWVSYIRGAAAPGNSRRSLGQAPPLSRPRPRLALSPSKLQSRGRRSPPGPPRLRPDPAELLSRYWPGLYSPALPDHPARAPPRSGTFRGAGSGRGAGDHVGSGACAERPAPSVAKRSCEACRELQDSRFAWARLGETVRTSAPETPAFSSELLSASGCVSLRGLRFSRSLSFLRAPRVC